MPLEEIPFTFTPAAMPQKRHLAAVPSQPDGPEEYPCWCGCNMTRPQPVEVQLRALSDQQLAEYRSWLDGQAARVAAAVHQAGLTPVPGYELNAAKALQAGRWPFREDQPQPQSDAAHRAGLRSRRDPPGTEYR